MGNPIFDGDSVPTEWRLERERRERGCRKCTREHSRLGFGNITRRIEWVACRFHLVIFYSWCVVLCSK